MKECPNCNKKYSDYFQYCSKCNYKLKYIEGTEVEDYPPEAHVPFNLQPTITCPYCKSTDTKKISAWDRLGGVFASGKVSNNWHCNRCDSDF